MSALELAGALVVGAQAYLVLGALFGVVFVAGLVSRVDPAATGSSLAFRITILPGCVLLWPLLLARVLRGRTRPIERNAHRLPVLQTDCVRGHASASTPGGST